MQRLARLRSAPLLSRSLSARSASSGASLLPGSARAQRRLVGALLGDVVRELEGPEAFAALQESLADPDVVLGVVQSAQQRAMLPNLEALVSVIEGFVDHVMDRIGTNLMPAYARITVSSAGSA